MAEYNFKRLSDPVHGSIGLSELETELIDTPVFQRLRQVKQLGLAHYAFPGADYSRFSHSLGVCHVTGILIDSISDQIENVNEVKRKYRAAALLHDLGHYPFSHAFENVLRDLYTGTTSIRKKTDGGEQVAEKRVLEHEEVSQEILKRDPDIREVLERHSLEAEELYGIFKPEQDLEVKNLVSSDLDADRIDYLLRTSHFSGLPYGSVDLEYILSQAVLDNDMRLCLREKALKAADHMLLSRYFDYQQIAFHKTVTGFEMILPPVLRAVVDDSDEDWSSEGIVQRIESRKWADFDDIAMTYAIRKTVESADEEKLLLAKALLDRHPPARVAEVEYFGARGIPNELASKQRPVEEKITSWAEDFDVPASRWFVWTKAQTLTSIGSRVAVSALTSEETEESEDLAQAIHILQPDGTSRSIMEHPQSLMALLSNQALYALRIYVLLEGSDRSKREAIKNKIQADLDYISWKT